MSSSQLAERWAAQDRVRAFQPQPQPHAPQPPWAPPDHPYMPRGRVLTIAGSDSGGGAGIQADLKTILALGGFGMSALTALTAQNTLGVHGVHCVPTDFVELQIDNVVTDLGVDCVKTGMLGSPDVVAAVASKLSQHQLTKVVIDPVMVAKGGATLLSDAAAQAVRERLLPLATVVTPNIPEAAALLGIAEDAIASRGVEGMKWACEELHRLGPRYVLVKGGHLPVTAESLAPDVLYDGERFLVFSSLRVDTAHTHGTGCTYAAAIATGLAQGSTMEDAVRRAKQYVATAIRINPGLGHGHGPLNHSHVLRRTTVASSGSGGGEWRQALPRYFVSDGDEGRLRLALQAGARFIHLILPPGSSTQGLAELAATLLLLCRAHQALLVLHDRVDICLAVGADGVHLGLDSLPCGIARPMLGPEAIVAVEVGGVAGGQVAAESGACFVSTRVTDPTLLRALCSAVDMDVVLLPTAPPDPASLEELLGCGVCSMAMSIPAPG